MRKNILFTWLTLCIFSATVHLAFGQQALTQQKTPPSTNIPVPKAPGVPPQEGLARFMPAPPSAPEILYLNEEQEAEVLEFIKSTNESYAKDLNVVKEQQPEQYRRMLSLAYREMRELTRLKEENPERYERVIKEKELNSKSFALAEEYRKTTDTKKKENIRQEIKNLLSSLFDYRQMNRVDEIEMLEKKLAELKNINEIRLENKEDIVFNRLAELLGEARGMEW